METALNAPIARDERGGSTQLPTIRIQPSRGWVSLRLHDLWEYRELLYFLVWRDVKVRYKQTVLGVGWVIIQPLATTLIFTVIFGNLAKIPSDDLPYPLFVLSGLVLWNYFSSAFSRGSTSLVGSAHLISKVFFPRLIIPIASVLGGLVDFAIVLGLVIAMMFFYGVAPSPTILALPFYILLVIVTALGVSLWLSALNVQYRDVSYLVPFVVQFWLYATPVLYASSLIPSQWQLLYALNPMVSVVEGFRWALFGRGEPPGMMLAISLGVVLMVLTSGAFIFRRMEKTFADVI